MHDSNRAGVEKGSNWSKWVPAIVILGLLAAWVGRTIWLGSNCTVYLLNGGSKPYEVRVNNHPYIIQPGQPLPIVIDEGDLVVEAVDPRLEISPVQCKVETPFFTRAFKRPAFFINPDESAIIVSEVSIYAKNPPMPPPPQLLKPQATHQLAEPDYLFASFPQTIQVKGSQNITKTRLSLLTSNSVGELLENLQQEVPDQVQLASREAARTD